MIIAIDGPAGSGKTTVAKLVAKKLGFFYLDTGAIYRSLTLKLLREGIPLTDLSKVVKIARDMKLEFQGERVFLDGKDITEDIRDPNVDRNVSLVAKVAEVRDLLLPLQRRLVEGRNAVVEGRDMGTVVFPKAELKVFLTASVEERAKRRWKELSSKGKKVSFREVLENLKRRDKIDSEREVAPLRKTADAVEIDTTKMSVDEVVGEVVRLALRRIKGSGVFSA